jgi:hypothetical protein
MQHGPRKRRYPTATLQGVTTQKTSTWIFTAVRTSNLTIANEVYKWRASSLHSFNEPGTAWGDMTKPCVQTLYWFLQRLCASSRDSSVGIALGYGLDDRGSRVRFPAGTWNFSLHHRVQNGSAAHPASYPMGIRGSFPGDKAAGAWNWPHHLVPRSKNEWSYTSTPPIRFHGVVLS